MNELTNKFVFKCDECGERGSVPTNDYTHAITTLAMNGWVANTHTTLCPNCVSSKEVWGW